MCSTTARPSPEAPPVTTASVCSMFTECSALLEADGRVHPTGDRGIVEPTRRDGLRLGVELHRLLAVGPEVAELRAARARKAEVGHRHRDGHVDAHLADIDFRLELACGRAALGEDAGTVTERIVVDELDRLIEAVDAHDGHHRSEDFGGVNFHSRLDAGKHGWADE